MFDKNSAFSAKPEVEEHLERLRADNYVTEREHSPRQKLQNDAAYHLLTAAEEALEGEATETAQRLIAEAKESLDADSV